MRAVCAFGYDSLYFALPTLMRFGGRGVCVCVWKGDNTPSPLPVAARPGRAKVAAPKPHVKLCGKTTPRRRRRRLSLPPLLPQLPVEPGARRGVIQDAVRLRHAFEHGLRALEVYGGAHAPAHSKTGSTGEKTGTDRHAPRFTPRERQTQHQWAGREGRTRAHRTTYKHTHTHTTHIRRHTHTLPRHTP